MRIMLGSMGKDKTIAPPENVLKRAVTAFKQIKRAATERPCIRIMATPMQLAYVPATVNTRSFGGQSRSRQMLFTADDLDIDLQVRVEKDSATLMGQVLAASARYPPSCTSTTRKPASTPAKLWTAPRPTPSGSSPSGPCPPACTI